MKESVLKVLREGYEIIDNVQIKFGSENVSVVECDKVSGQIVYDACLDGESNRLVIVHPSPEGLFYYLITALSLAGFSKNLKDDSTEALKNLKPGDRVIANGKVAEFVGVEEQTILGKTQLYIRTRFSNLERLLPVASGGIMPYYGNATRINKYESRGRYTGSEGPQVLSELFNIPAEKCERLMRSGVAILCDKTSTIDNLKRLKINGVNFTDIFPAGYYKNATYFEKIGHYANNLPLLKLCSSITVLQDMINEDADINTILVMGTDRLRGWYSHLDALITKPSVENMMFLSDWSYIENDDFFKNNEFRVLGWNKSNLLALESFKDDAIEVTIIGNQNQDPFTLHRQKITNYIRAEFNCLHLKSRDSSLSELFEKAEEFVSSLARTYRDQFQNDEFLTDFFTIASRLFYRLQSTPYPLEFGENLISNGIESEDLLRSDLEEVQSKLFFGTVYIQDIDLRLRFKELTVLLKEIYDNLLSSNPKALELLLNLDGEETTVVVNSRKTGRVLKEWLKHKGRGHRVQVIDINQLMKRPPLNQTVLFTGWFGKKMSTVFYKPVARKLKFLLYGSEYKWFQINKNTIEQKVAKLNLNINSSKEEVGVTRLNNLPSDYEAVDLTELIERITFKIHQLGDMDDDNDSEEEYVTCTHVLFEERKFAYFTKRAIVQCLESDTVRNKQIMDLVPGDELIFVNDPEGYLLKEVIKNKGIIDSGFDTLYTKQYSMSQLWRKSLLTYAKERQLDVEQLQNRLKNAGCERSTSTISGWLNNVHIVGPAGNAVESIAVMTKNSKLLSQVNEVKHACYVIRRIHRTLREIIYRNIARSLISNSGPSTWADPELSSIAEELPDFAEIACVLRIGEKSVKVPMSLANKLLGSY